MWHVSGVLPTCYISKGNPSIRWDSVGYSVEQEFRAIPTKSEEIGAIMPIRKAPKIGDLESPPISTPGGSVELSLSSVGSHFPRSVSAGERFFEVLELDGCCAVVEVRGDDEIVEHAVAEAVAVGAAVVGLPCGKPERIPQCQWADLALSHTASCS